MLIRNNKNAPIDLFVPSARIGHQKFRIDGGAMVATPEEHDDEIRAHRGNSMLLSSGQLEEITDDHVRVSVPEDGRRSSMRLEAPITDERWAADACAPLARSITIEAGDSMLVHPDFLTADGGRSLLESAELEVMPNAAPRPVDSDELEMTPNGESGTVESRELEVTP